MANTDQEMVRQLAAVVKQLEWSRHNGHSKYCPVCLEYDLQGHKKDCVLGIALAEHSKWVGEAVAKDDTDQRWRVIHRPGEPEYERIKALQPFPMTQTQLVQSFRDELVVEVMRDLQAVMEPAFQCCPWCGHSGPLFSLGDHNQGCPFYDFLLR